MKVFTQEIRNITEELLDQDSMNLILRDWVQCDSKMKAKRQEKVIQWDDPPPVGSEVSAFGCVGVVCTYSILENKEGMFERCVWVKFKQGELLKALKSECSAVTSEDKKQRNDFEKKLLAAGRKVERQKKERRAKTIKGSHLLDDMLQSAESKNKTVDKKSGFYKITSNTKGHAVYVSIKGGRVDLSGFCIEHDSVKPISAEEAKSRHIGRVRGQIDFTKDDNSIMEAFNLALEKL